MPVTHNRDEILDATIYTGVLSGEIKTRQDFQKAFQQHAMSDDITASVWRLRDLIECDGAGKLKVRAT